MWALLLCVAMGAEVDVAPSGTVVTVRPEKGEQAILVRADTHEPVELSVTLPEPMWLVHPESWRQAVALAEKYQAVLKLPEELKKENERLEHELSDEKRLRSETRLDFERLKGSSETETKMLRKSRTTWTVGGVVTGVILGSLGTAMILL
jgi:hypothetical protein